MATAIYGGPLSARNGDPAVFSTPTLAHPGLVAHPLITAEVQVCLLATIDETGDATLDDLARAIPDHDRPVSAVLALVDAGVLGIDLAAPFDASCRVWRLERPRA